MVLARLSQGLGPRDLHQLKAQGSHLLSQLLHRFVLGRIEHPVDDGIEGRMSLQGIVDRVPSTLEDLGLAERSVRVHRQQQRAELVEDAAGTPRLGVEPHLGEVALESPVPALLTRARPCHPAAPERTQGIVRRSGLEPNASSKARVAHVFGIDLDDPWLELGHGRR